MKDKFFTTVLYILITGLCGPVAKAQTTPMAMPSTINNHPWTDKQLMEPVALAASLENTPANQPLILNIGAVEDIMGAKHIGAVSKQENMEMLENTVSALPKTTEIVIYCGCCPFTKCPNIRPAFLQLQKLGFTNVKLLNLPVNLQSGWISKGYPLAANR